MRRVTRSLALACLMSLVLPLAACGGGGGGDGDGHGSGLPGQDARTLLQFGYRSGTGRYEFGYESIRRIEISGAPADVDMSRFAMCHNGSSYLLFAFRQNSDRIYAFRYDGRRYAYVADVFLRDVPSDADVSSLAATYSSSIGHSIYLRSASNPARVYQFQSNSFTGPYTLGGGGAFSSFMTTGMPPDVDYSRWTIFFDGSTYRQAIFRRGSLTQLYQFGWNGAAYAYGHNSTNVLNIVNAPPEAYDGNAKILHDGAGYRLYQLAP